MLAGVHWSQKLQNPIHAESSISPKYWCLDINFKSRYRLSVTASLTYYDFISLNVTYITDFFSVTLLFCYTSLSFLICLTLHSCHSDQFSFLSVTLPAQGSSRHCFSCSRSDPGMVHLSSRAKGQKTCHPSSGYSAAALLLTLHA